MEFKQLLVVFVIGLVLGAFTLYGATITGAFRWADELQLSAAGIQGQSAHEAEDLARSAVRDRSMGSQIAMTLKAQIAIDKSFKALKIAHSGENLRMLWDIQSSETYGGMHDVYATVLKDGMVHKAYSEEVLAKLGTELNKEVLAGSMYVTPYAVSRAHLLTKVIFDGQEQKMFGGVGFYAAEEAKGMVREAILNTMVKDSMKEARCSDQTCLTNQLCLCQ
jgi:hypothetical protein